MLTADTIMNTLMAMNTLTIMITVIADTITVMMIPKLKVKSQKKRKSRNPSE